MEKLKLHTPDFTDESIAKIAELFPHCVAEVIGENGKLSKAIDFDLLRQELSGSIVDGPQNRYRLDWPGKPEALLAANSPIAKTLRPCREESVNFDNTKNLYIEGDNLDALKLLQETYLNKVKMIYIDPPYNTGKDFVYSDNFKENSGDFLIKSNQIDEHSNRLIANTETNGRFHSDWLSMIYPRLRLARNILTDDGIIFISIDDNEVHNLRKMCDEVFGEQNFVANVIWEKAYAPRNNAPAFSESHDHILCYAKNYNHGVIGRLEASEKQRSRYTNRDNDPRGDWKPGDMTVSLVSGQRGRTFQKTGKGANLFEVASPSGKVFSPPSGRSWVYNETKFSQLIKEKRVWWGERGDSMPSLKRFWDEIDGKQVCQTIWKYEEVGHNQEASKELKSLFPEQSSPAFATPKPTRLIERMVHLATKPNDIILDYFAGSSSTAEAVLRMNASDCGNRRYIMVQIPEPCDENSEPFKAGYKTIAEISIERIRRSRAKIRVDLETQLEGELPGSDKHQEVTAKLANLDTGFRVLKVDTSNMEDVYYKPDEVAQEGLDIQVENIKPDRSPEDLLFQVLLDWGVDLGLSIEQEKIDGKTVFFVDGNALAACFDPNLNEDFVKTLAQREPLRAVFRDSSFSTDATKINIEQIFRAISPYTELKVI